MKDIYPHLELGLVPVTDVPEKGSLYHNMSLSELLAVVESLIGEDALEEHPVYQH